MIALMDQMKRLNCVQVKINFKKLKFQKIKKTLRKLFYFSPSMRTQCVPMLQQKMHSKVRYLQWCQ